MQAVVIRRRHGCRRWAASLRLLVGLVTSLLVHGAEVSTNGVWWSFRPVANVQPPVSAPGFLLPRAHPVDSFINVALRARALEPVRRASPRELVRRAHLDLIGLPPSYEEVVAFESDARPDAWERLIDRLLARPEYGERWGRHWLDVVRFAQSSGYERDGEKPFAWRYRDYVVRAFNADVPYDRFVREHLAGDLQQPFSPDAVIATGYARLGVWDDEPDDKQLAVFEELDDVLSTTGVAFLGLTLGCARCHEHKFDPISHADYYRMLAFFRGVAPMEKVAEPGLSTAHVPLAEPAEVEAWRRGHEARLKTLQAAVEAAPTDDARKKARAAVEAARRENPPFEMALAMKAVAGKPEPTHILKRGNPRTPGDEVEPAFLAALHGVSPAVRNDDSPAARRRALADWVSSRANPLTARVMVNRVWHHHFGRGLVRTTGDFGRAGALPSHPELLDWLARDFMGNGWSLKQLHRRIMTSEAYQRSTAGDGPQAGVDPANELLWRQNLRRLEAEVVRDSVLAISGNLNRAQGGRGFFPRLSGEVLAGGSRPGTDWELSPPAELARRSLYAYVRRTQAVPFLEALDYANTTSPLTERPVTTVAPQALLLLNDDFMRDQAAALARSVRTDGGSDRESRIRAAFRRVLSRHPSPREVRLATEFIERQQAQYDRIRDRLVFRTEVPATMNVSYFDQLKPHDFMTVPAGWRASPGNWPDVYEANRILQRGNGPFALSERSFGTNGSIKAELVASSAVESAGLLFGARSDGGRLRGYELAFDRRDGILRLILHGTNQVVLATSGIDWVPGRALPVRVEHVSGRVRVWVGAGGTPAMDLALPTAVPAGLVGIRVWGGALSVDAFAVTDDGGRVEIRPSLEDSDPERRAIESFCLLLLNLNEVVYMD